MDQLNKAQKDGVVVGLKAVSGVVPRLDIDKLLVEAADTFNLFCLALTDLMSADDNANIMGYYQISGIHGLPKVLWDNIDAPNKEPGSLAGSGYCAHSSLQFPPWHRPYLSMIEQTIFKKMVDIAETFPEANKQMYRDAARKFRLPYWDYYRPRGKTATFPGVVNNGTTSFKYDFSVPQIFTVDKIMLKTPAKNQLTLSDNPLRLFDFPRTGGIPLSDWRIIGPDSANFSRTQTQRYPAASDAVKSMNAAINKAREGGTNQIMNMISDPAYNQYSAFATDSASNGPSGSLEGIHGNYHVLIGGPAGHMSRVPVAAFDPMFWLHHCQIDRWFAVWQAVHPNAWFSSDQSNQLPFRISKSPEQFWTARGSRSTDAFGYTYPDLAGGAGQVKTKFRNHYSWSVRTAAQPTFGEPPSDMAPLDISKAQVFQFTAGSTVASSFNTLLAAPIKQVPELVKSAKAVASKEIEAKQSKEGENKNPSDKKAAAKDKAFRNIGSNDQIPITAPSAVKESEVGREWFVDNIVERLALNGAFTIYFFIGKPPGPNVQTSDFISYPTLAGVSHVFTAPTQACSNCDAQNERGQKVTNTAPITPILLDYVQIGELLDLHADRVKPFLVKNLKWRVVEINGDQINPRTVAGLKIGVSSKLTALGGEGDVTYQEFPEVVEEIVENSA